MSLSSDVNPNAEKRQHPLCVLCKKNEVPPHVMPADKVPVCDACQRKASEGKGG